MLTTGRAQREGNKAATHGRNASNTIARIPVDITRNASSTRASKRQRFASIGDSDSSGLVINGTHEAHERLGLDPDGATPPISGISLRSPDFPISFSGRGVPKFTNTIRLAGIDGSTSISENLTVSGDLTVAGTLITPGGGGNLTTTADPQSASGVLNLTKGEASTNSGTGTLRVTGGVGVTGDVHVDGDLIASGSTFPDHSLLTTGNNTASGVHNFTNATSSTLPTNGALVVGGGVGIAENLNVGGDFDTPGVTSSSTITNLGENTTTSMICKGAANLAATFGQGCTTGSIIIGENITSGLVQIGNTDAGQGTVYVSSECEVTDTTASTSTSTGSLTAAGGVGVAGDVYIGGTLNIGGAHLSGNELAALQSTGLEYGGQLSVASGTTIAISDGAGVIIDSSNPAAITETLVTWSGLTGETISTLGNLFTYIYIDNTGSVVQSLVEPTPVLRRDNIFLGKVFHADGATVNAVNNQPEIYNNAANQQHDFYKGLGPVVLSGLRVSSSSLLTLDLSAGSLHQSGINFHTDPQQPNIKDFLADPGTSFVRSTQTTVGTSSELDIDQLSYDNGGTITTIAGSNNQATNMRVYLFNSGFISVQYGQTVYSTLAEAEQAVVTESFVVEPFTLSNGILLCIISVTKGCTDLTVSSDAEFFNASKFGEVSVGVGGTATSNLQNVYDNSPVPQILLASAIGGLQIQDAATPIGAPLFQVNDSTSSYILNVEDSHINIANTQDASSTTTGALRVAGGFGCNRNAYFKTVHIDTGSILRCQDLGPTNASLDTDIVSGTTSGNVTFAKAITTGTLQIGKSNATHFTDILSTTPSSSSSTGALVARGGVGIAEDCYVGADLNVTGTTTTDTIEASAVDTGSQIMSNLTTGSIDIGANITTGKIRIGDSLHGRDASSAIDTGGIITMLDRNDGANKAYLEIFRRETTDDVNIMAAKTAGDADLIMRGTAGSTFTFGAGLTTGTIDIGTSLTSGSITLGASGTTGQVLLESTLQSTSTNSGALEVNGGVGIAKDVFVGGNLNTDEFTYGGKTTSVNTTCNSKVGYITLGTINTNANTAVTFTNSEITTSNYIFCNSDNGNLNVGVDSIGSGTSNLLIKNTGGSNITGALVYFMVI